MVFTTAQEVEKAFCRAFAAADFSLTRSVWAAQDIACVHPGGDVAQDPQIILDSWNDIPVSHGAARLPVELLFRPTRQDQVIHVDQKHFGNALPDDLPVVVATNIYRRQADGWHLCLHHTSTPVGPIAPPAPTSIH